MLYPISVGAANFGIPGILGKFKTVNASTTLTKTETTMVPTHPNFLPCQINNVKTKTSVPKAIAFGIVSVDATLTCPEKGACQKLHEVHLCA